MTAAAVLARVHEAGGEAIIVAGRLRLRARHPLPDTLVAEARQHKNELLALLTGPILAPATPEQVAEEVTDRIAIVEVDGGADPARWRLVDRTTHAALLRRLQDVALQRPPSWWTTQPHRPAPGAWCSCCRGHRWWTRDGGRGWCCQVCHPPPRRGIAVEEIGWTVLISASGSC
jgi:hypothetical protein